LVWETGNFGGTRAYSPDEKMKWFYHFNLSSCGHRAKRNVRGQARLRNICFGNVFIVVRQGRQRRDAAEVGRRRTTRKICNGEEQILQSLSAQWRRYAWGDKAHCPCVVATTPNANNKFLWDCFSKFCVE
jgi:hypothetical protein